MKKVNLSKSCPDLIPSLREYFFLKDVEEKARTRKMPQDLIDKICSLRYKIKFDIENKLADIFLPEPWDCKLNRKNNNPYMY